MDLSTIINVLDKYGWGGIACIVILVIVYYIVKFQTNKMNKDLNSGLETIATKITDNINSVNTELIRSVTSTQAELLDYIKTGQREEHLEDIDKRFEIAEELQETVRDINNKYHCDRTCILELHNSKENFTGLPFAWYDVQYEHMKRGIEPISNICKNMQAANLIPIINDLKIQEYVYWTEKELNELFDRSPVLYSQLIENCKAKAMIYYGLYSKDNRIIGFLALEYHSNVSSDIIDFDDLQYESAKISTLLQLNSNKN